MRKNQAKNGSKEFFYSSLDEFREAILARAKALGVKLKKAVKLSSTESELDVNTHDTSIPFGSQQNALSVLMLTLDNYEASPSNHSVKDFCEQSFNIFVTLRSKASTQLLRCHALQKQYKELEDDLREKVDQYKELLKEECDHNKNEETHIHYWVFVHILPSMSSTMAEMYETASQAQTWANTSLAAFLVTEVLEEGPKALENLPFPGNEKTDSLGIEVSDTVAEINEAIDRYNKLSEAKYVDQIVV